MLRTQGGFATWVKAIPKHIARFAAAAELGPDVLDFGPPSLSRVNEFVLSRYPSSEALFGDRDVAVFHGAAAYIGEVYIRALGGGWTIVLEDRNGAQYIYKGHPIVRGPARVFEYCPHASIMTRVYRRDELDLKTVFDKIAANVARKVQQARNQTETANEDSHRGQRGVRADGSAARRAGQG
jgi:hypothetical protein